MGDRIIGMSKRALVVVDVQNDFTEGGPFDPATAGNDAVAERIGRYTARFRGDYDVVITTQDWHIEPADHFVKHAVHCVADTVGAELDPQLSIGAGVDFLTLVDLALRKGLYADDYSGFNAIDTSGTTLPELLQAAGVSQLDVCGFAADGCVAATARDAADAGFEVTLLEDLSGVFSPATWDETVAELQSHGAKVSGSVIPD
jgi:nicotinamidase/pyrazinamidase